MKTASGKRAVWASVTTSEEAFGMKRPMLRGARISCRQ